MKETLSVITTILLIVVISYGGWRFERWWHYKFSYSSQVTEQIQPLVDRVTDLEKRVEQLEGK